MALPFLDTNVFLRHLRQDHPDHSPRATAFFKQIEDGSLEAATAHTVVFEAVFTLQSFYKVPRADIRNTLLPLLQLPGLKLPRKRMFRAVFDLYVTSSLSFADAYHAVLVRDLEFAELVSFDKGFDRLPWLKRREP
jgi:predicted nucleic acid-binding protein